MVCIDAAVDGRKTGRGPFSHLGASNRSPARGRIPEEPRIAAGLAELARLTHHRWALPVMAALSGRDGVRFVELQAAVPASRQPMRDALEGLVESGWVVRHGGHGHPLRPEYLVTARGRELAPLAREIQTAIGHTRRRGMLAKKWSLPILAALLAGAERFNEIRGLLGDSLTPRALALTLRDLEDASLVERTVGEGRPPQVRYHAVLPPTLQAALESLVAALAS